METAHLKKFAQTARRQLLAQVGARLEQVLATDSPARREHEKAVRDLERRIAGSSKETIVCDNRKMTRCDYRKLTTP